MLWIWICLGKPSIQKISSKYENLGDNMACKITVEGLGMDWNPTFSENSDEDKDLYYIHTRYR